MEDTFWHPLIGQTLKVIIYKRTRLELVIKKAFFTFLFAEESLYSLRHISITQDYLYL